MRGKITIEAVGDGLHITGTIGLRDPVERYIIVRGLTRSLGIDSPEELAEVLACCLLPHDPTNEKIEHTEIRLPIKKEKHDGLPKRDLYDPG